MNSSVMIQWGSIRLINGYFFVDFFPQDAAHFLGMFVPRNTSIFVEAPMFAYILTIGIAIRKFLIPNGKKIITFILIATVISTTSTTAMIMLVIIYAINFLFLSDNHSNKIIKYLLSLSMIVIFGYFIIYLLQSKQQNMAGSFNIRVDDIFAGLDAWKQHIFIGNGFNSNDEIQQYMNVNRWIQETTGYSSGIFLILAWGGMYLALMYIIPIFMSKSYERIYLIEIINLILLFFVIVPFQFIYIYADGWC